MRVIAMQSKTTNGTSRAKMDMETSSTMVARHHRAGSLAVATAAPKAAFDLSTLVAPVKKLGVLPGCAALDRRQSAGLTLSTTWHTRLRVAPKNLNGTTLLFGSPVRNCWCSRPAQSKRDAQSGIR
jgi:hypothetical protein